MKGWSLKERVLKELSFAHFPFKYQLFSDAAPTFQYAFIDQTVQPGEFLTNFFCSHFKFKYFKFKFHIVLVGPTRALQVSPRPPPPLLGFLFSALPLSHPHVFGNPVILLI
jgi:hypothetical protein